MNHRVIIDGLRILLVAAVLAIASIQLIFLPWLSGEVARDLPAEAFMRWPILGLSIAGLACVQVGLVSMFRLLGLTKAGDVFSSRALRWVDAIIGAALAASLVCAATIVYQSFTVGGPPVWMLLLWCGVLAGIGIALLMVVMRGLLVQATTLRYDMEAVI